MADVVQNTPFVASPDHFLGEDQDKEKGSTWTVCSALQFCHHMLHEGTSRLLASAPFISNVGFGLGQQQKREEKSSTSEFCFA